MEPARVSSPQVDLTRWKEGEEEEFLEEGREPASARDEGGGEKVSPSQLTDFPHVGHKNVCPIAV